MIGKSLAFATALLAASPAIAEGFAPGVDENGKITLPAVDFHRDWSHLGDWSVVGEDDMVSFHSVYTQPETVDAFRKTGEYPDGAVLIKELRKGATEDLTTGTASHPAELIGWFVMIKDRENRFEGNPLWGDGWGWAFFAPDSPGETASTDYTVDCLACHEPVRDADLAFSYAYPTLRGLSGQPDAQPSGQPDAQPSDQ